ncbi:MAB_1171c family putative transporter [Streptomyces sp. NPDC003388]
MSSGPSSLGFYISGTLLLLACAMKIPALIRRRHDTLLQAACLLLFSAACLILLAAPESIVTINQLTKVPNAAAPLVYAMTTAFSGVSLVLIVNWRSASPEQTRRVTRLVAGTYSPAIVAIIVLFWAGDASAEQVTLFDAYYANTPYIREMIVTYLLAQAVAMAAASTLCWRWSAHVQGSLRAGLRFLAPAYLCIVAYDLIRLVAVAARWTGRNLDFLVDKVSPQLAVPAGVFGALGFVLPLTGPRLATSARALRQLRQLTPLWKVLEDVPTPGAIRAALPWWRTPPAVLLTGRRTAIHDAILALAPYCDPVVRQAAYDADLRHGGHEAHATVTGNAAMILVARERQRTAPEEAHDALHTSAWRLDDLVHLSQAIVSPIVQQTCRQYRHSLKAAAHHD